MKKILFICGSMNQTTMMHQIAQNLSDYDNYFTPYYSDGIVRAAAKTGILDFSVLGGKFKTQTLEYLYNNKLKIDSEGKDNNYDLVVTCSDLIVPKNIRDKKVILVQEGMTDPENLAYYIVKTLKLPRYFASTSVTGLSDAYDIFCVASEGYRELFIKKGVRPEKIAVTGIPNFDNCRQYLNNSFPYRNYVLVCTSDMRETYKYENRKKFILEAVKIANGRQIIFKLHPNEKFERAKKEVDKWAPGSLVFQTENTNHMIANCDVLITRYSTVVYVGIALGKEVYSAFDIKDLKRQAPIQNGGMSASNIARICREMLEAKRDITNLIPDLIKQFSPQVALN
ncbi:MAG TPA: hypothetical protein VHP32_03625 [Ignavibacteria bacterium]|nr:hypothetical protein [Ignavibacteria bacterium]